MKTSTYDWIARKWAWLGDYSTELSDIEPQNQHLWKVLKSINKSNSKDGTTFIAMLGGERGVGSPKLENNCCKNWSLRHLMFAKVGHKPLGVTKTINLVKYQCQKLFPHRGTSTHVFDVCVLIKSKTKKQ